MPLTPAERFAAMSPEEQAEAVALAPAMVPFDDDPPPSPPPGVGEPFDLDELYGDTLDLTFRGRTYTLHAPDIDTGLLCQRIVGVGFGSIVGRDVTSRSRKIAEQVDGGTLDDDAEEELYVLLLGGDQTHPNYRADWDVFGQLKADRVPWKAVEHFGVTALWWTAVGEEFALDYWRTGGRPKAPASPAPAPRQPTDRKPSRKAGGRKTTKTASSTGSSPRKRAAKAAETGTPGSTS